MEKSEAETADQLRDIIENPEECWRKLEAEIRSWLKCLSRTIGAETETGFWSGSIR